MTKSRNEIDIISWHLQVKDGLYPLSISCQKRNIEKFLNDLPLEESKKTRRKFRKAWRKILKKRIFPYPLKTGHPSLTDMHVRKIAVLQHYVKKAIKYR